MEENAKLTSICLSSDCKYALVNLSTKVGLFKKKKL